MVLLLDLTWVDEGRGGNLVLFLLSAFLPYLSVPISKTSCYKTKEKQGKLVRLKFQAKKEKLSFGKKLAGG